jgi:hypothetical protein
MAQTISELEKERAKLLEAIEAQANQLSKQRGSSTNEARPHTLNDWLNAAEQVVPTKKEPQIRYEDDYSSLAKPRNSPRVSEPMFNPQDFAEPEVSITQSPQRFAQNKPANKKAKTSASPQAKQAQKASFFGVIIMLSLLMTVVGVVYVAYNAVQRDMQQMAAIHSETLDTLSNVQIELLAIKEQLEKGSDAEMFDQLIDRIEIQQTQLQALRQSQVQASQQINHNVERQIEMRLQAMLTQLSFVESMPVEEVTRVHVSEPDPIPRVEQKLVRLVEPKAPVDKDVNWLRQQAADNYVLQLASMPERAGVEKVMADKRIQNGRIIPQIRDGRQSFLLVVGSNSERAQANQMALEIKEKTGISPWIRRVRDLTGRID